MEKSKYGMPTFFEINVGLAYFMFAKEKLDYTVMETGLGGTLDATNTVSTKNKICIITKIGLDHTEILGKTFSKIASEKAGIIQCQNTTINIQQTKSAQDVIEKRCIEKKSELFTVKSKTNFSISSSSSKETVFDFSFSPVIPAEAGIQPHNISPTNDLNNDWIPGQARNDKEINFSLQKIQLGLVGKHQTENCSLALACLSVLSKRDKFKIKEKSLRKSLEKIFIAGRFEIKKIGKQTIIIDGAHNPQKMETFTSNLSSIFPQQKFVFIVAFKKGKDYKKMLKNILPLAEKILLTGFSTTGMDNHWNSIDNNEILEFLKSQKIKKIEIVDNNKTKLIEIIKQQKKPVVITGSLYLISSIYNLFKK
jgi:dihydrofolate synthase/folylpolyglutamate synthase